MKRYKKEYKDKLEISQVFYNKRFILSVDRSLCKGCDICRVICPREAITLKPVQTETGGKAIAPVLDIDENKCDFHGICAAACPFSAIKITLDNEEKIPAVSMEVFPVLIRDIEVNCEKCEAGCKICEEKCPLRLISVKSEPLTPEEQMEREKEGLPAKSEKTVIDVKKENCVGCQVCWMECPSNAIRVTKFIEGSLKVNQDLCPEGCHSCLDVCPVNALYFDEDNKINVNGMYCIYCGACLNVCPEPGALELSRTSIRHTPVESGAWNKALEKLTSTEGLNRELAARRSGRARDSVKKLKVVEVKQKCQK